MVESILLYGAEIWGVGNTDTIETAQLKYYKTLMYLPQYTSKYAVIQETGINQLK
jgi:indole-3-glycerol phosphate synthase